MVLEDKDIIQIDATVIVGVLILLTLSSIGFKESEMERFENPIKLVLTLAIIGPFTMSALSVLYATLRNKSEPKFIKTALIFMLGGFIYLLVGIVMLIFINFI